MKFIVKSISQIWGLRLKLWLYNCIYWVITSKSFLKQPEAHYKLHIVFFAQFSLFLNNSFGSADLVTILYTQRNLDSRFRFDNRSFTNKLIEYKRKNIKICLLSTQLKCESLNQVHTYFLEIQGECPNCWSTGLRWYIFILNFYEIIDIF